MKLMLNFKINYFEFLKTRLIKIDTISESFKKIKIDIYKLSLFWDRTIGGNVRRHRRNTSGGGIELLHGVHVHDCKNICVLIYFIFRRNQNLSNFKLLTNWLLLCFNCVCAGACLLAWLLELICYWLNLFVLEFGSRNRLVEWTNLIGLEKRWN